MEGVVDVIWRFWMWFIVISESEIMFYFYDNIIEYFRIGILWNIVVDFNYLVKFVKVFDVFVIIMIGEGVLSWWIIWYN